MIVFVGSVFSPYYAWSGYRDPLNHCSVNMALYGPDYGHWTMTERGQRAIERRPDRLRIGPSEIKWQAGELLISVRERSAPWARKISGTIRVTPHNRPCRAFAIDGAGRHNWQPIAPYCAIEVALTSPELRWRGTAYFDSNWGEEPLQSGFRRWTWSRAHLPGKTVIFYDTEHRGGTSDHLSLGFGETGAEQLPLLDVTSLPKTGWRLRRECRSDAGAVPSVARELEDGPFYSRSLLRTRLFGEDAAIFHECVDLDRFSSPLVRAMLPFRMPRRAG